MRPPPGSPIGRGRTSVLALLAVGRPAAGMALASFALGGALPSAMTAIPRLLASLWGQGPPARRGPDLRRRHRLRGWGAAWPRRDACNWAWAKSPVRDESPGLAAGIMLLAGIVWHGAIHRSARAAACRSMASSSWRGRNGRVQESRRTAGQNRPGVTTVVSTAPITSIVDRGYGGRSRQAPSPGPFAASADLHVPAYGIGLPSRLAF